MKELWTLFITFMRIGGLTFGGGYAMLPMLQREVVERRGWATEEELMDYYAIGQCTPGIIAVNTATFIGNKYKGIIGGVVATLGVIFPSLVIITIIAALLNNFADIELVKHAFAGIRVAVAGLIISSILKLAKSGIKDVVGIIICVAAVAITMVFGASPIYCVVGGAAAGIIIMSIKEAKKK